MTIRAPRFLFIAALCGALAACASGGRSVIGPIDPLPRSAFDKNLVAKGANLAAIGNCESCHTAERGKPFAGGRPMHTPFGVLNTTNITPDPETGIGRYSEEAFARALHEGVDREGRHLYPAFPYEYYTRLTDEDVKALYAYMMTREPVRAQNKPHELPFPLKVRAFIGVWKAMYFERTPFVAESGRSPEWNRGAYLVTSLSHCSACHTPRNFLGAEKKDRRFSGGEVEGWLAPAVNAESPSPSPWTVAELQAYLRTGFIERHAIAAGPMADVVTNLSNASAEDVRAIGSFIGESLAQARPQQTAAGERNPSETGRALYAEVCGGCHDQGRTYSSGGALQLERAVAVTEPTSKNLMRIAMQGIASPEGTPGRMMPGFADVLTDGQVRDLMGYIREHFAKHPPWNDVDDELKKIREGKK